MTYEEKQIFLRNIYIEVEKDTSLFAEIVNVCNSGVKDSVMRERKHAADMETVAIGMASLLNGKYREKNQEWIKTLIASKAEGFKNTGYLGGWDEISEQLRNEDT